MNLVGLLVIRDNPRRRWAAMRYEIRRSGVLGLADALLFRLYARARLARHDDEWKARELARLRAKYPADLGAVPRLVVGTPNSNDAKRFIASRAPDLIIARCKFILQPSVFTLARVGSFALHPGICPEYRNAHGCFWALARRDLDRVGMTLLRIDSGVDTGPVYLQATCKFDELNESHTVIQYRAVLDNLEAIAQVLTALCREGVQPISTEGRMSAAWGHPRLTDYLYWKRAARRSTHGSRSLPALS